MLSSIFPTNNQKSLYLLFRYISTNVIFSTDGMLTSLDIDFEYMTSNLLSNATCTNFKHSPEDSIMAETS